MVGRVFRRSLSFPNKPSKPPISHHIRSISLPCRSHPLISQIRDEVSELKTWSLNHENRTADWLSDGLNRLKDIHDSLCDLLQLPQTHELLSSKREFVEKVLEDFLQFVDVYGIFQSSVLALKEAQQAAQVAVRRKDESRITLYLKSRKRIAKEMAKLVSSIKSLARSTIPGPAPTSISESELVGVIGDVIESTASVSVALFNGISFAIASKRSSCLILTKKAKKVKIEEMGIEEFEQIEEERLWGLRKKGDEEVRMVLTKMQDLERCISSVESESGKVFRSLINTRVSLLNTLTN
ncbi:hypothetical protein SLEP1_g11155 [Rubroshorea leprosula]|uniref:DUF241 domain protein n=1 Tax=Rubroshorea leprosula TaxID=152421 RepID=A0AAV5ILS0_9ROSI|nr:hypothetical protein SLEP1_g11155 [Rubroshorea leprosula]